MTLRCMIRSRTHDRPRPAATSLAPGPSRIGPATFRWGERTFVMGILNVTPNSFSGDGLLAGSADPVEAAVEAGRRMVDEGADLLDVGGESTRPGHAPVALDEERRRVVPVIAGLRAALPGMPLSIDTTKPAVAEAALAAGADLVNDVWGVGDDETLARLAADHGVPLVVMHNRAEARYTTFLPEVIADLQRAIERALRLGVRWDDLIVDPGFGFGKTPEQNLALVRDLGELRMLGRPILLGTSRKSTLGLRPGPARRPNGSRRPSPRPRSGSPAAPTSSASTTSAERTRGTDQRRHRARGRRGPTRDRRRPQPERPDRPREHALPGSPRLLRPRAPGHAAVRGRCRARRSTSSRPASTTTSSGRSTTARSTRPSGRSSNRPRSACSRRWPRRSATSSWPTSRSTEVCVRVRKPEVRLSGPLDYAGVEIRRQRPNGDRRA